MLFKPAGLFKEIRCPRRGSCIHSHAGCPFSHEAGAGDAPARPLPEANVKPDISSDAAAAPTKQPPKSILKASAKRAPPVPAKRARSPSPPASKRSPSPPPVKETVSELPAYVPRKQRGGKDFFLPKGQPRVALAPKSESPAYQQAARLVPPQPDLGVPLKVAFAVRQNTVDKYFAELSRVYRFCAREEALGRAHDEARALERSAAAEATPLSYRNRAASGLLQLRRRPDFVAEEIALDVVDDDDDDDEDAK